MSVYIVSTVKMILISGWPPVEPASRRFQDKVLDKMLERREEPVQAMFTDDSLKILEERGIFICFVTSRRSSSVFGTGLTDISLTF
ncbi:unnamed protein product [Lactuca virosa]|uniref:Uncharacterized protein n=1 Tax=Lactuca virosa TaxID=75947 RepID=A0AAU9PQK9_9ASTR|nr:unnamed protein product [Lactuca virosa]